MSRRTGSDGRDDAGAGSRQGVGSPPLDAERLYHELQVHQFELEQQNEELRAARAEIEELLRRYTDLYDFAPVAYVTLRRDWTIEEANLTAAGMLGVPRSELRGRRLRSFLVGDTARDLDRFLAGLAAGRRPDGFDVRLRTADGTDAVMHIDGSADRGGGAFRVVLVDVTARTAAEAALTERTGALEEAQRIAHVGSWTWDPAADVAVWSPEMLRIYGLDPHGPTPSFAEQARFYDEATIAATNDLIAGSIATGEPYAAEYLITRDDGSIRRVRAGGEVVRGPDGAVASFRGTVADVTELREAQARLDRAERVEMVGRLAAGVAHDFNNLLAAINGYAEFLADEIPADDPMHGDVEAIREAGSRAADLTRQLLAFGRRQTLRPTVVDVDEVLGHLGPILRSLLGAGVDLVTAHAGPPARTRVDRTSIEQAITNLVLNARDAMPAGGRLTITTTVEEIGRDDPRLRPPDVTAGDFVHISVADTGTGIDPDVLPHVFEPFFTTQGFGRGAGLGLSSVEGAVAQAHGFVTVDSTRGEGSTFSLFLPRAAEVESAPVAERIPAVRGSTGRRGMILLVEDEPAVRAVTARALRDLGHTVVEAADASLALGLADSATESFDLLVTDIVMPGMNGRALAEILAARYPGLEVIYMSGYSPETVFGDGLLPEGTPYLRKPFERAELVEQVEAALTT